MNFCGGEVFYSNNDIKLTRDEYFNLRQQSRNHQTMAKKVKKVKPAKAKMPMKMKGKAC